MNISDIIEKIFSNKLNFRLLDAIDILLVATGLYFLLSLTRKTRASQVLKGLGIFIILAQICKMIGLSAMSWVLDLFISSGLLIIAIVFQPELRRALEHVGRNNFLNIFSIAEDIVVVEEHFTRLKAWLEEQGITVETVPYREISKMGGLLRCSTLPLVRD